MSTTTVAANKPLAVDVFLAQLVAVIQQAQDSEGRLITSEECSIVTYQTLEWVLRHPELSGADPRMPGRHSLPSPLVTLTDVPA